MIVQITRDQGQFFYSFRYEQMVLAALKLLDIAAAGRTPALFSNDYRARTITFCALKTTQTRHTSPEANMDSLILTTFTGSSATAEMTIPMPAQTERTGAAIRSI